MASLSPNILQYDITAYLGDTLTVPVTWKDSTEAIVSFTGSTGIGQIKVAKTDTVAVKTFTVTLGATTGNITFSLTAAETAALGVGTWVYDIQVTTGTTVRTYVTGKLKIIQDVSRA